METNNNTLTVTNTETLTEGVTIKKIDGDDRHALVTSVRDGVAYEKKMLVFSDLSINYTYALIEKMEQEGKL
jgi:hypothetical protein